MFSSLYVGFEGSTALNIRKQFLPLQIGQL
jgi:hypothetical protein